MAKRLFSLLLVMAMLLCSFAACSDDKDKNDASSSADNGGASADGSGDGESVESAESSEESKLNKYDQITDSREKLVYFSGGSEDVQYVDKIENVLGDNIAVPAIPVGDIYKVSGGINVSEFSAMGRDMMDQLGGALGANFSVLTDGTILNMNGSLDFAGVSADATVSADENGVFIASPFMLKQPIYVDGSFLAGLMGGYSESEELVEAFGSMADAFAKYAEETLTEENIAHLQSLAVQMLPEDSVTESKVTLDGVYTKGSVEADCIVLNLSGESLAVALGSFRQTLYDDVVFKEVVTGFFGCFTDLILGGLVSFGGEGDVVIPSDAELYDSIFDMVDELVDEIEADNSTTFIIKRYFVDGVDARFDMEAFNAEERAYISYWDIYSGDANDYGFVMKDGSDDDEYDVISITGGYDDKEAFFKAVMNTTSYDVEDSDGNYEIVGTVEPLVVVEIEKTADKLIYNFDVAIDEVIVSLKGEDGSFDLNIENGDVFALEVQGSTASEGDKTTTSGVISVTNEGVVNEITFTFTESETVTDTKYESTLKLEIGFKMQNMPVKMVIDGEFAIDADCGETPLAPTVGDDSFVVDGEDDFAAIAGVFTDTFMALVSSFSGNNDL